MHCRTHPSRWLALALLASGLLLPGHVRSDDSVLFSTVVPPNVMLLVDNSGSMHHVVWHPDFDPTATPTCTFFDNDEQYFVATFSGDTNGPSSQTDYFFAPGTYSLPSPPAGCISGSREIFVDPTVDANSEYTRWMGRYLNWYYSAAANVITPPATTSPAAQIVATSNGNFSPCLGGGTFDLYRRSRIQAAQDILREVICQVNAAGAVRFGLAQFRRPIYPDPDTASSDPNGGYVRVPANDYSTSGGSPNVYTLNGVNQSHGAHLDDAIDDLTGESWTPLAESLLQVYQYFMSRNTTDIPVGADLSSKFPKYSYTTSLTSGYGGPHSTSGPPTVPDSPVQWACQKNFVVIITDGEPTRDDFDVISPTNTAQGFANFANLIGDYNPDGENETPGSFTGCTGCEATRWLDDIARFMQQNDFRPDLPAHNGQEQVIDVYTVGFTTSAFANAILQKTAAEGNGQFYFSNDPQSLSQDIVSAITDIIQKSQSFTAATVPAVRTSQGGKFYTSVFVPSNLDGYWEGHLESWSITPGGEIHDKFGNCALNDPNAPAECHEGTFLSSAQPFWDAGAVTTSAGPGGRNLFTSLLTGPGTSSRVPFTTGALTAADMNLTAAEIPNYTYAPNPAATTAAQLKDMVVDNVRGCQFGQTGGGCTQRPWLLGDIFHSSPVVVPGPQSFFNDQSFRTFETNWETRQRVILAGSNDGFLHFFDAGTWQAATSDYDDGTGAEIAGFMPYEARQNAKYLPIDTNGRNVYFVDGSPSVADVWFYSNARQNSPKDGSDWQQWRTIVMGGMRQGGSQYYALDITNPGGACQAPATGTGYPCYLWEFPREDAATGPGTVRSYLGQSWSEPIIAKVKVDPDGTYTVGYDRWVAIFTGGYSPQGDPNDTGSYDATATAGRAIFMVDLKTGKLLGMKAFDASTTPGPFTDPTTIAYDPANPERSMHYALASTPGVYDLDFDGYADVVYVGDLGGNVWKWVIKPIGDDPVTVPGSVAQPRWTFTRYFAAPTAVDGATGTRYWKSIFFAPSATLKNGVLWLAFGTGERMNLKFMGVPGVDENNRFYAMTDLDPLENAAPPVAATLTEASLLDLTASAGSACTDVSAYRGFYFKGVDGEKFVTQSDIFFYYVFAASYTPTVAVDPCSSGGNSTLYSFKVYCGEGLFDKDGDGVNESTVSLGAGMPTDPKVTISSGGGGGGSGPSPNRVIINKQDGELETEDAPPGFGAGIGQFYWRELSN